MGITRHKAAPLEKNMNAIEQNARIENAILADPQAAAYLQITPRTLRLWRKTRGLPFIRITKRMLRYRKADLDRWLEDRRVAIG